MFDFVIILSFAITDMQEKGQKHQMAMAKVELIIPTLLLEHNANGSAGSANGGNKARRCKWSECSDVHIADNAKFASVRSTSGCVLSMHPHCWQGFLVEQTAEQEEQDPHAIDCPCGNCDGFVHRVLLRQAGKTLTMLLEPPVTQVHAAASEQSGALPAGGDDDDDDEDDDEDEAESEGGADDPLRSAAELLDPNLRSRPTHREKKQMRAFNIAKV
jgi:hypothetical protein